MSRSARVAFDWADGHHAFRLGIGELEELQERTGVGPFELLTRLGRHAWRVADVREPLRLGLIGAGMPAVEARKLVDRYAGPGDLLDAVPAAMAVVNAALAGAPDEESSGGAGGNAAAAKTAEARPSPTAGSPSPPSTEPAP